MTYQEAVELKKSSMCLIGTTDNKGYTIKDILVVPADQKKRNDFFLLYLDNHDAIASLSEFMCDDLLVMSVDDSYFWNDNLLFYNIIQPEPSLASC